MPGQQTPSLPAALARDVAAVGAVDAVPKILEVICRTTGLGFSAVARVTDDRWIACAVRDEIGFGLVPGGELPVETTICDQIRDTGKGVVIDHVATDPHYCNHPTPRQYGFQSYISVPIRLASGTFFGTLCAIDPRPGKVSTPATVQMFQLFAELIAQHLDAHERLVSAEQALLSERESALLREQFIAVLGHDLRNPLAAINAGIFLMQEDSPGLDKAEVLGQMQSSGKRMRALISDVLDFARGRLGGGMPVRIAPAPNLARFLQQAVAEQRMTAPGRTVHCDVELGASVSVDEARLAQMVSNLVSNALVHGSPESAVWVRAGVADGAFELSVRNHGPAIPAHVRERLFRPFVRGVGLHEDGTPVSISSIAKRNVSHAGVGLGLYIASEIARSHRGTLTVRSADGETCFTFRMPLS